MNKQPLLIRDAYEFGPPLPKPRETPWEKLYRFFFGDDVFISYARADAIRYVPSLAARLAAKKYICFFDQLIADPNEDLPERLKNKILRSTVFVLVGTQGAVASSFVRKEIELFRRTRRPFIPVDVDGALVEQEGWQDVIGVAKISEQGARVRDGDPSPEVINLITDSFRYTRRSHWLRASLLAGLGIVVITAALSFFVIRSAAAEATAIKRQAYSEVAAANQNVVEARQRLQSITAEAALLKADAADARNNARSAATAAEAATTQQQAAERAMRQAQELERQSTERAAETSRREAGSRAALLAREPGMGPDALALAVQAAEQSVASHDDLPDEVLNGVVASIDVTDYSLPLEDVPARGMVPLISPDGEKILGTFYDPKTEITRMALWDSRTGKRISDIPTAGLLIALSFSRDSKRLATIHSMGKRLNLAVWDLTGPQARRLETGCDAGDSWGDVALDRDGSHVMVANRQRDWVADVTICEIATGREEVLAGVYPFLRIAFTPEDEPAVYGPSVEHGLNTSMPTIYFLRSGRKVTLKSPGETAAVSFVGFGDDGSVITMVNNFAVAGQDSVYVQSADGDLRRLGGYRGTVSSAALVGGQVRVVTYTGRAARVADARISPNFSALRAHARPLDQVDFSPDGRTILTLGDDGKARLWDAQTSRLLHTLAITDDSFGEGELFSRRLKSGAFRADGKLLVTVNEKKEIQIWDVNTGRSVCSVPRRGSGAKDFIFGASFFADGDYVLTVYEKLGLGFGGTFVDFLDARTCKQAGTFPLGVSMRSISFSHDGATIVSGPDSETYTWDKPEMKLWNLRGLDVRGASKSLSSVSIKMPPGRIHGFSLVGTRMLAVSEDETGQLLVSDDGSLVRLEGWQSEKPGSVRVVFSADGTRAAALSGRRVWVWDTHTGKLLVAFECDVDMVSGIPFSLSPDGSKFIIGGRGYTVRIYPTSREDFFRVARRLLGR